MPIFGHPGLPALGISGAGWAYVATEAATFLLLLSGCTLKRYGRWHRPRVRKATKSRQVRSPLRLSVPVAPDVVLDSAR